MRKRVVLTAVMLVTVGVGSALKALTLAPSVSTTRPPTVTISIDEIHRQVDVTSLPVLEVKEPF
jgi:hypothetical protein